jgi:hypothetical protein
MGGGFRIPLAYVLESFKMKLRIVKVMEIHSVSLNYGARVMRLVGIGVFHFKFHFAFSMGETLVHERNQT